MSDILTPPLTDAPANAPALITAKEAAALLSISVRHFFRLVDAGKAPAALRLGASIRWRRNELENWLTAGCPPCRTRR